MAKNTQALVSDETTRTLRAAGETAWQLFLKKKQTTRAMAALSQTLEEQRRTLGAQHPDVLETLKNLAFVHYARATRGPKALRKERLLETKHLYGQALLLASKLGDYDRIASIRRSLAFTHAYAGEFVHAARYLQQVVDLAERISSSENRLRRQLPHLYAHLGSFQLQSGKVDAAIATLHRSIEEFGLQTGRKSHPDAQYVYSLLSRAYAKKAGLMKRQSR